MQPRPSNATSLLWLPALSHAAGWGVDLPRNASQVLLNLGCNLAPVLPDDTNDDAVVLCFEPIPSVVRRIPAHPRLLTIPAAVSSFDGVATMHTYAKNAQSSSLGARAKEMDWNDDPARGDGDQFVVPVLSLRSIYASLGPASASRTSRRTCKGRISQRSRRCPWTCYGGRPSY